MEQALITNVRRDEWIQHRNREREPITRISYDAQNNLTEETYTREEWRTWGNYEDIHEDENVHRDDAVF